MHATSASAAKHTALVLTASVIAYLLLATLQNYSIAESVGLALPPWQVFRSTVKLLVTSGPWIPFLMHPPASASS
ncbi:hypothetical protein WJX74_008025 [Apatococcus lobatus]|uniref:Uncharacterized protein n=1 Tax=Apatococcus lobatus TaxID=904363 RepID=A0AAW1R0X3_9CHLO